MEKILAILKKYNKQKLLKNKLIKNQLKKWDSVLKQAGMSAECKEEIEFFIKAVITEGILNKQRFEKLYEDQRREMYDIWENLDYKQRNTYALLKTDLEKKNWKHFSNEGQDIYIPFFDLLMNSLYDKEPAILELPQFFKMYQNYNDKMSNIFQYQLKPFAAGFSYGKIIPGDEHCIGLYIEELKQLFVIEPERVRYVIPFSEKAFDKAEEKDIGIVMNAVLSGNPKILAEVLMASPFVHEKAKHKIEKKWLSKK